MLVELTTNLFNSFNNPRVHSMILVVDMNTVHNVFPTFPLQDTWSRCISLLPVIGWIRRLGLANECEQKGHVLFIGQTMICWFKTSSAVFPFSSSIRNI